MNRLKATTATLLLSLTLLSCASYNAHQKAQTAETIKDWDTAVMEYEKALEINPENRQFKAGLDRARRESSRAHFEKAKAYRAAADKATGNEQLRLAQMSAGEFQIVVRLDTTNQFAAVEYVKVVELINTINRASSERVSIDEIKKRAQSSITKAQPPQLNPASNEPISLTFSRDTPVKDIYRALGNAFGINVLFDQAVKDDRITIELRDVTAQAALERVMQAANHFYKVLDEKTIIVVPDNPQARRDYEDLVIRTFYLSNGDAEQVTNVVRTMIEARNVFPLKALNAITIRDTADKVRIAEKIIQANDKAKAEVVVQVELVQLDLNRIRDLGFAISGFRGESGTSASATAQPTLNNAAFNGGTLADIAKVVGSLNDLRNNVTFSIPSATYSLMKSAGNSELLANPELRISEGEKATLHIGQRIPVPVTTFSGLSTTTQPGNQLTTPYTSFQYQDVGIKVEMEPRVHHNREVTLKLTVEVSNQGASVEFAGQEQPTFATRTITSTIRLKDGETNFLAGLIQSNKIRSATKTPLLGDLPLIGRLFTDEHTEQTRTDLVLTMTPHIIRIPDITDEDLAPMWVGTGNNLTFRGVSPRIESQNGGGDPFVQQQPAFNPAGLQLSTDGEPGNYIVPEGMQPPTSTEAPTMQQGTPPSDPFRRPTTPPANNPPEANPPGDSSESASVNTNTRPAAIKATSATMLATLDPDTAALRLAPRLAPQPATISLKPGESRVWEVIGMDLEGLTASQLVFRFNPKAMSVTDINIGAAILTDLASPPMVSVNHDAGTITITQGDGKPLRFAGGGQVLAIRVHGGLPGETFLVMENPDLHTSSGQSVVAAVAGGRAKVQ
ncbi:MAG TPA: secretin N-terminal domain-containing protein [Thermoanaerobaculia bacterium]|jgi:general secretion pathway protein D|nr:secretin N-terminal domain-containing protein [Thermoanaerobaculia bacterium]